MSAGPAVAHVVCFGNAWQGDDGFGQHVFRRLGERAVLPRGVAAFDAGTAGLNALHYFEGCAKAVIVDAVRTGARVGTVQRLLPTELEAPSGELSMHDLGVSSLLAALAVVADEPPVVVLVGAEVGELRAFTDRLSPPLEAALPTAVRLVLRECEPRGGAAIGRGRAALSRGERPRAPEPGGSEPGRGRTRARFGS